MPRTTIKRTAIGLAGIVALPALLLSGYVSAWLVFVWWATPPIPPAGGADPYLITGYVAGPKLIYITHPAFAPIDAYLDAELPGSDMLLRMHCIADPNCD